MIFIIRMLLYPVWFIFGIVVGIVLFNLALTQCTTEHFIDWLESISKGRNAKVTIKVKKVEEKNNEDADKRESGDGTEKNA